MPKNRLVWDGLDEFMDAMKHMPDDLAAEGANIVNAHAYKAASAIIDAYPERSGALKAGVKVRTEPAGRYEVRTVVENVSHIAVIYEYGTQARHYYSEKGGRHDTGAMPAAPPGRAFWPKIEAERILLYEDLVAMVQRHGVAVANAA